MNISILSIIKSFKRSLFQRSLYSTLLLLLITVLPSNNVNKYIRLKLVNQNATNFTWENFKKLQAIILDEILIECTFK